MCCAGPAPQAKDRALFRGIRCNRSAAGAHRGCSGTHGKRSSLKRERNTGAVPVEHAAKAVQQECNKCASRAQDECTRCAPWPYPSCFRVRYATAVQRGATGQSMRCPAAHVDRWRGKGSGSCSGACDGACTRVLQSARQVMMRLVRRGFTAEGAPSPQRAGSGREVHCRCGAAELFSDEQETGAPPPPVVL